ncbi:hypothetical protein C8Q70DRAFT_1052206 [Cubamyces menziesii]|nr:hypothetical protein C8Q70DRAFT_1052206 [Cubamyces menziesii]
MTRSLEKPPSRTPSRQPSLNTLPKSSPSPSQTGSTPPSTSTEDHHPCTAPARSNTHAAHHTRASVQLDRVIRRTCSFSAHLLSNSAKQSKALKHQIASRGKLVFHPLRAKTFLRLHAEISHSSSSSRAPSVVAEVSDSNTDQSSSEEEGEPQFTSPFTPAPAPIPSPEPAPSRRAAVSRAGTKNRKASTPSPRTSITTNTSSEQSSSNMPSSSTPSTPERSARSRNQSPRPEGPRPTTSRASRCFKSKPTYAEPIRYARPARPENSLPGVVFETRYENPIKTMFGTKTKGDAGSAPSESTPNKSGSSLRLSQSSSSIRRLIAPAPSSSLAADAATDDATDADVSASEPESRRSSIDSTASTATNASKMSTASKFSRMMRRKLSRRVGGSAPAVARNCNETEVADPIAPDANAVAVV